MKEYDMTYTPADLPNLAEIAYGLLWRINTTDQRVHEARRLLLEILDEKGQKRGIEVAKGICHE